MKALLDNEEKSSAYKVSNTTSEENTSARIGEESSK
jgi:hypothetical protein